MAGCSFFGSARVGTRPGHHFADLIFKFALGLVMKKIGHTREREGLIPAYVATDNLSFMDSQCSKTEQGAAIGFVDDLFFNIEVDNEMVLAEGGECVVERVCRALQIIA